MAVISTVLSMILPYSSYWSLTFILCIALTYYLRFAVKYPTALPLAGESSGKRFFSLRTRWRYYTDCASLYRETYEKYSKINKTVLLPGFGFRHDIILPHSSTPWVLSHTDHGLSHVDAILEIVQLQSGLGHTRYKVDPWPGMLVKHEVNARLEHICVSIQGELQHAVTSGFGATEGNWNEIDIYPAMRRIVAQMASRFTVGLDLCRNKSYIEDCVNFTDEMTKHSSVMGVCPRLLRPVLSPMLSRTLHRRLNSIRKHIEQLVSYKINEITKTKADTVRNLDCPLFLDMMLQFAARDRPDELYDLDVITRRLSFANFASMHQTSILFSNLLVNITASDREFNTISVLRDEITQVLGCDYEKYTFTKQTVARLIRMDSAARETLRLNANVNRSIFRKVVRKGLKTPDGIVLPENSYISVLSYPAQCDAEVFHEPFKYDPFRFSRAREAIIEAEDKRKKSRDECSEDVGRSSGHSHGSAAGLSFVSISNHYLPFGYGNHSCPGRFLVDFELKMMLAYVLLNYDLELPPAYGGQRPPNKWIAEVCMPPVGVRLRLRRVTGRIENGGFEHRAGLSEGE